MLTIEEDGTRRRWDFPVWRGSAKRQVEAQDRIPGRRIVAHYDGAEYLTESPWIRYMYRVEVSDPIRVVKPNNDASPERMREWSEKVRPYTVDEDEDEGMRNFGDWPEPGGTA